MGMGFGEREDKGADKLYGFAWVGMILRPSLDLNGRSGARRKGQRD